MDGSCCACFRPQHSRVCPCLPCITVMDDGGSPSENQPDVKKMTVQAMKQWLMDHGQEEQVWQMSSKKAKKADWEAAVRRAL